MPGPGLPLSLCSNLKTWAHPGDIECQDTDTGVLLTIRQPKNTSFAIRNEKGLLLQIFIDPTGEWVEMIRNRNVLVTDKSFTKHDKFSEWNNEDRAILLSLDKRFYTWGAEAGLKGKELDDFVKQKLDIAIKLIF